MDTHSNLKVKAFLQIGAILAGAHNFKRLFEMLGPGFKVEVRVDSRLGLG